MSKFADFCADYFKRYFDLHPSEAIYYGIGGYDHLLTDYSDETYQSEKAFTEESLQKLRQISLNDLNQDETIDHALLAGRLTIQQYEHAKEDYRLKWTDIYLLLKKKHFLNDDVESLLAFGEDLFAKTKQELTALADELAPGKTIEEVARIIQDNHPGISEILPAYHKAMEAARDFVKEQRLLSLPP